MIGLMPNQTLQALSTKFASLEPLLDERTRRLWAAAEARAIGRGGITWVSEATGLSRVTIRAGSKELDLPVAAARGTPGGHRVRSGGGGRKSLADHDPKLLYALETLVDPATPGRLRDNG